MEHMCVGLVWRGDPSKAPPDPAHIRLARIFEELMARGVSAGAFVSAHPDVILKMGTKEVLYRTRSMGWGTDTRL